MEKIFSSKVISIDKIFNIFAILLAILIGIVSFVLTYLKFLKFDPSCTDFSGIHAIATRSIPNLLYNKQIDFTLLAVLFMTPIMLPIALLFKIFNSFLIVISYSAIFAGLSVYIYFLLARKVLNSHSWALLLSFSFAIHPVFDTYATLGYKPEILGNFAILASLLAYTNKNRRAFIFWLIVAILTKIEYLPVCALLSFWLLVFERNKTFGKSALILSGIYIFLTVLGGSAALVFSHGFDVPKYRGGTLGPLMAELPKDPAAAILYTLSGLISFKSFKIFLITLPVLFFPYLEPSALFIPALFQILGSLSFRKLFVSSPMFADLLEQSPPLVAFMLDGPRIMIGWLPFVYLAAAKGLAKVLKRINSTLARLILVISLVIASSFSYYYFIIPAMGPWPFTAYWDSSRYAPDERSDLLSLQLQKLDKPGLKVALTKPLDIYLKRDDLENVETIPSSKSVVFDAVLIDLYLCEGSFPRQDEIKWILEMITNSNYRVQLFQGGIIVLVRGESSGKNREVVDFINKNQEILKRCFFGYKEYSRRIEDK